MKPLLMPRCVPGLHESAVRYYSIYESAPYWKKKKKKKKECSETVRRAIGESDRSPQIERADVCPPSM